MGSRQNAHQDYWGVVRSMSGGFFQLMASRISRLTVVQLGSLVAASFAAQKLAGKSLRIYLPQGGCSPLSFIDVLVFSVDLHMCIFKKDATLFGLWVPGVSCE